MLKRLWGCYTSCAVLVFSAQVLATVILIAALLGTGLVRLPVLPEGWMPRPGPIDRPEQPFPQHLAERWQQSLMAAPAFQLDLTEGEVNALLAALESRQPTPLRRMRVELHPGRFELQARLPDPLPVEVRAPGRVSARAGLIQVAVEEVQVAGLPLPQVVMVPFVDWANQQLRQALVDSKAPLSVESVELLESRVVVRGRLPIDWRPEER